MSNNNNNKKDLKAFRLENSRRIRGFSVELLLLIKRSEPVTTRELSILTGKPVKTVYRYLYNLRSYGYVKYRYGYWFIEEHVKKELDPLERKELQITIVNNAELSDDAQKILYTLLNNYTQTNRKYLLFQTPYDIEETFKLTGERLRNGLVELLNKGIIYYVRTHGLIKIGLVKSYVEKLLGSVSKIGNNTNTTTTQKKRAENP